MILLREWNIGVIFIIIFVVFGVYSLRSKYQFERVKGGRLGMSRKIQYGSSEDQFFVLHEPKTLSIDNQRRPVMILIHGGYWKQYYNLNNALCDDLVGFFQQEGYYVSQLEYRRGNRNIDGGEGGWPETNIDIALAFNSLFSLVEQEPDSSYYQKIDLTAAVVIGHSAGGTLALWTSVSGSNEVIQRHFEGSGVKPFPFTPRLCVAIAPIGSLLEGFLERLSDKGDAVEHYLKAIPQYNGEERAENLVQDSPYRLASPDMLLPMKTRTLIVAGDNDFIVPLHVIRSFAIKAIESSNNEMNIPSPELLVIPSADHFQLVNPQTIAWRRIYEEMQKYL